MTQPRIKYVDLLTLTDVAIALTAGEEVRASSSTCAWRIWEDTTMVNLSLYSYQKIIRPFIPENGDGVVGPDGNRGEFIGMRNELYVCIVPIVGYVEWESVESVSPVNRELKEFWIHEPTMKAYTPPVSCHDKNICIHVKEVYRE